MVRDFVEPYGIPDDRRELARRPAVTARLHDLFWTCRCTAIAGLENAEGRWPTEDMDESRSSMNLLLRQNHQQLQVVVASIPETVKRVGWNDVELASMHARRISPRH